MIQAPERSYVEGYYAHCYLNVIMPDVVRLSVVAPVRSYCTTFLLYKNPSSTLLKTKAGLEQDSVSEMLDWLVGIWSH